MAQYKFTTDLNKELRKTRLNVKEKAFADLLIMGWDMMDAYTAVELYNPLHTVETNFFEAKKLREENQNFIAYYNTRIQKLNAANEEKIRTIEENLANSGTYESKYRDKDEIITALAREADNLRGKDRVDVLNKIADLQRMKQEENKTEEERVHYFLPLTCCNCPLFIENKKAQSGD